MRASTVLGSFCLLLVASCGPPAGGRLDHTVVRDAPAQSGCGQVDPLTASRAARAREALARGEACLESGDYAMAERWLSDATRLEPAFRDGFLELGLARHHLGDIGGALDAWETYVELAGETPEARAMRRLMIGLPASAPLASNGY